MAQSSFPLPLRNALAELILAGFDDAVAAAAVHWLADGGTMPPAVAVVARLADAHLIDQPAPRLLDVHAPWTDAVQEHARRGVIAHDRYQPPATAATPIGVAVAKAAALWDQRLFFEVHEILEAQWLRTTGAPRTALQGLIQVAVAFHHLAHGNTRGARSLFRDGRDRLASTDGALDGLDTARLLAATADWDAAVTRGAWDGAPPPLPFSARRPGTDA